MSQWPTYRQDPGLRGHCSLPGRITSPRVAWSTWIGGTLQQVHTVPGSNPSAHNLLFCHGGALELRDLDGQILWRTAPRGFSGVAAVADIDEDGALEIVVTNGHELIVCGLADGALLWREWIGPTEYYGIYASTIRCHKLHPELRGMQLIVPALHHRSILVYEFSGGARHGKQLHALQTDDAFHPTVVVGDIEGRGQESIVVTRLGSITVFDPISGERRATSTWETDGNRRRGYGQIQLVDIDHDGELELVVLARQVTRHIAVLDHVGGGTFEPMWDRLIEHIYPEDRTDLRHPRNAVMDVDGDGEFEIVASMFDDRRDGRWHTEVLGARSGELKCDVPDVIANDVRRVDGIGSPLLCLTDARTRVPSGQSALHGVSIVEDDVKSRWSCEGSRFATHAAGQTPTIGKYRPGLFECDEVWNTNAGLLAFADDKTLVAIDPETGALSTLLALEADVVPHRHEIVAALQDTLVLSRSDGEIRIIERGAVRAAFKTGISYATDGHPVERPSPTASTVRHRSSTMIAVPDHGDSVRLFEVQGETPSLRWRVSGRGRIGFDRSHHFVTIDNSDDPTISIAVPEHSALVEYDIDGAPHQRFDFADWPSSGAGPRTGPYDWSSVKILGRETKIVSGYASLSMNSESTRAIEIGSGTERWRDDRVGVEIEGVGFGPWGTMSIHGDTGYFCAKAYLCAVDLSTGALRFPIVQLTELSRQAMIAAGTHIPETLDVLVTKHDPFTAYGNVVLCDVDDDGRPELFVMGCLGGFGMLRDDGTAMWWHSSPLTDTAYHNGAICDVDGDGKLELGLAFSNGEFVCLDGLTGVERWRITLGATGADCVSCDIDGDGRDEYVCRTSDGRLLAIGTNGDGLPLVKWSLQFDSSVGNPVIADITGHGVAEILVVCGDGMLYCII